MKIAKIASTIVGMYALSFVLAGCSAKPNTTPTPEAKPAAQGEAGAPKAAEDKKGDTTLTGMISKVGEKFYITVPGQSPKEIESYLVQLDDQVGKKVTIVGQYSGDTLFVGKVE